MADTTKMSNTQHAAKTDSAQEKKEKPYFPRPKNRVSKFIPKPTNISKSETPLTNDPLWKDSFIIDGETGFVNEDSTKTFEADAAGYAHLIESEYKAISDVDKYYAKPVSPAAHAYYHNVLYWYQHALRAQKNGTASMPQERLVQFVQGYGSAMIASGAGEYLEGLGDYTDATGTKHRLHATEPNDEGHFGRITQQTHGLYETLPAPAIVLQRVAADILQSRRDAGNDDEWMLPGLAPAAPRADPPAPQPENARERQRRREEEEGEEDVDAEGGAESEEEAPIPLPRHLPTVNLLGWQRARVLSANQISELANVIDADQPRDGLVNQRYCINRDLFELVERKLRECKRYKLSLIPSTTGGSLVQQVIWKPLEPTLSRHKQAVASIGIAISRTTLGDFLHLLAFMH